MKDFSALFGASPFDLMVAHARKVHECVAMVRPLADAIIAQDADRVKTLQEAVSQCEFEADSIRSAARGRISRRLLLSAQRNDLRTFIRQLDRMGDDAEAFAITATYRTLCIPEALRQPFLALIDKVVETSECLLSLAERISSLQLEAFDGPAAKEMLEKINEVGRLEWITDNLGHEFSRAAYSHPGIDPVTLLMLDKLATAVLGIADHADNVGRSLGLMIRG